MPLRADDCCHTVRHCDTLPTSNWKLDNYTSSTYILLPISTERLSFNNFSKGFCKVKGELLNVSCSPFLSWLQLSSKSMSHLHHFSWTVMCFEILGRWNAFYTKSHLQSVSLISKRMSALILVKGLGDLCYTLTQEKKQAIKGKPGLASLAPDQTFHSASPGSHFCFCLFLDNF